MSLPPHPEWDKENSLTSPEDRDKNLRWRPDQTGESLTNEQVEQAMQSLNITSFTSKFPRIDKTYSDPPIPLQNIGLISFTPAKGAIPNENGIYGFAKLRGNYSTPMEADQRAEFLIRNADSYHKIYHTYVGRPFPITYSSDYSAETSEIDIRKDMTQNISSHIKQATNDDRKTIQEIKERESKLLADSKVVRDSDGAIDPQSDPYENYITLQVKRAQLSWTFLEHLRKLREIRDIIVRTRENIHELDQENPEFKEQYYEKYMQARRESGFQDDNTSDTFMRYLVAEAKLPTIDTDEVLPVIPDVETVWSTTVTKQKSYD